MVIVETTHLSILIGKKVVVKKEICMKITRSLLIIAFSINLCTSYLIQAGAGKSFGLFAGGVGTGVILDRVFSKKNRDPQPTYVVQQPQPTPVYYVQGPTMASTATRDIGALQSEIHELRRQNGELQQQISDIRQTNGSRAIGQSRPAKQWRRTKDFARSQDVQQEEVPELSDDSAMRAPEYEESYTIDE